MENSATCQNAEKKTIISSITTSLTEAALNNVGHLPALRLLLEAFSTAKYTCSFVCCLVIDLCPFLSYCFLNDSNLVTLCSCKTVHHAVHIKPRQLRMIFETLFRVLQWKRRLAALQKS